jgi:hypothetical protein
LLNGTDLRRLGVLRVVAHFDQVDHPLHTTGLANKPLGPGASLIFGNTSPQRHHTLIGVNVDVEWIDVILLLKVDPLLQSMASDPRIQTRI